MATMALNNDCFYFIGIGESIEEAQKFCEDLLQEKLMRLPVNDIENFVINQDPRLFIFVPKIVNPNLDFPQDLKKIFNKNSLYFCLMEVKSSNIKSMYIIEHSKSVNEAKGNAIRNSIEKFEKPDSFEFKNLMYVSKNNTYGSLSRKIDPLMAFMYMQDMINISARTIHLSWYKLCIPLECYRVLKHSIKKFKFR